MWSNYFYNIQKKYSMRVSLNNPLVIRLDGKNVTKSKQLDLLDYSDNSYSSVMQKTVSYFTRKI